MQLKRSMLAVVASLCFAATAAAHGTTGPHGGPQADAGDYHVELVAKGTALTVYLSDKNSDKPIPSAGHKATAIFTVDKKPQRIELTPAGDNKLTGQSTANLPAKLKGAVQIVTPAGKTAQAKFD